MARSKKPHRKPDVRQLLSRLAAEEDAFLHREFMAPALPGGSIRVRIAGAVCRIRVEPSDFAGWGVFQPLSHTEAILVREATLSERRSYLQLFPTIRLIVCRRVGQLWYGSAASFGDRRIRLEGLAPIQLAEEVQLFDCVRTRYDGTRFWFDELDMRHDPGTAAYLRSAIHEGIEPGSLQRPGLASEERAAYELHCWERQRPAAEADRRQNRQRRAEEQRDELCEADVVLRRLRESLSHAGARLVDYLERADSFRVTFSVGGQNYTSSVDKEDLTVQVAGICLSGEDQKFDLSSLIGVLREGSEEGAIVPVGEHGMDENEYWRVHPHRN